MKMIAALLGLFMLMGCALTDLLLPSGAPTVPPMTPTYTPYPPTSGVPTFTPLPSATLVVTSEMLPITPAPTGSDPLPPYLEITYSPTEIATLMSVSAVYQPFERGFMVYIEGQTCLFAYAEAIIIPEAIRSLDMGIYRYCVEFAGLPPAPADAPLDPFGRVWAQYPEMRASLGVAVGAPERYQTVIPRSEPIVMGGVFYSGMVTLPDGRQLYCGTRGATAGRCEVRN